MNQQVVNPRTVTLTLIEAVTLASPWILLDISVPGALATLTEKLLGHPFKNIAMAQRVYEDNQRAAAAQFPQWMREVEPPDYVRAADHTHLLPVAIRMWGESLAEEYGDEWVFTPNLDAYDPEADTSDVAEFVGASLARELGPDVVAGLAEILESLGDADLDDDRDVALEVGEDGSVRRL